MNDKIREPRAAQALAQVTDTAVERFRPDFEIYPMPDPDDLECVSADSYYEDMEE